MAIDNIARGLAIQKTGANDIDTSNSPSANDVLSYNGSGELEWTSVQPIQTFIVSLSDEYDFIVADTNVASFRVPFAITLQEVRASLTVQPTGSEVIVDINKNGTSILSTKLTIDALEKTSVTASVPAVISDTSLEDDDEITFDIDQIGSSFAGKGLKVTLIGEKV
jgi:hypothetical protein